MKKIFTLIAVLACALGVQAQDTWTIAGEKAILGVGWAPEETANDMTSEDGVNFTLVKTGMMVKANEAGYGFKVVKNHSWDESYGQEGGSNNATLPIAEDGEYTITFTFNAESHIPSATATKTGDYVAPVTDQTWTVVGAKALTGASWADDGWEATYVNDMTSTDGVNFTLVKEDLVLESGVGYGFKVVADHAWDESYPGDNATVTVTENGKYTVTFKFNKDTKEVSADAVKTGEAVIGDKVWTIAGSSEAILGTSWDPTNENNDMTDMGDGTFQLVKANVALEAETKYEFKVLANHSWDENYGADGVAGGENCTFSVDADGNYDVTFVWNPDSKELYATADEATGIKGVKNAAANKNTTMYNLQGQRVQAGFRGIVIMNGRKMIVK
jgi:hypothetical protein